MIYYSAFSGTMENVAKHRDSRLVKKEKEETISYRNQINIQQNFFLKKIYLQPKKTKKTLKYQ